MVAFENIHTRDEAFYKEIYFHHYFKSKIYRFIDILMGISFYNQNQDSDISLRKMDLLQVTVTISRSFLTRKVTKCKEN
jgi:hypothetical protein